MNQRLKEHAITIIIVSLFTLLVATVSVFVFPEWREQPAWWLILAVVSFLAVLHLFDLYNATHNFIHGQRGKEEKQPNTSQTDKSRLASMESPIEAPTDKDASSVPQDKQQKVQALMESPVDIDSKLMKYKLNDQESGSFGHTKLAQRLVKFEFRRGSDLDPVSATAWTSFLVIPSHPFRMETSMLIQAARDLFEVINWYNGTRVGARYYAKKAFPLSRSSFRFEQDAIVLEDKIQSTNQLISALKVDSKGEIYYVTSQYTTCRSREESVVFRLGGLIHLLWSLLALARELYEHIEYEGDVHFYLALSNTNGAFLGDFLREKGPDPCHGNYVRGPELFDEVCRKSNILASREYFDLSTLEPKVEPDVLHSVAEEVARAFNQGEARCFDEEGKLPDDLWPISSQI